MNIGVDARTLANELTGIGRYTYEVSKELIKFPNAKLSFYSPASLGPEIHSSLKTASVKSAFCRSRFSKMVWSQTQLPLLASGDQIDLFWGPTHRLPRLLNSSIAQVVTIHDLVWKEASETMRPLSLMVERRLMPAAIKQADLVMVDSNSTAHGIAKYFPQFAHKVRVVYLGVSQLLNVASTLCLPSLEITKPYFLFVGTIEPRKNLPRLLEAFSSLPKFYRDEFSLVIAGGGGWGEIDLEMLIQKNDLQDSVRLLGYIDDNRLHNLYLHARFLVMPSLYEGFGLPLVEAMQYGTPILTSKAGSMPEIAGDAAMLIDPFEVDSIAKGLEKMLSDDAFIELLRSNALVRANHFSWEKCATQAMAVFNEAISLRNSRKNHFL